MEKKRNPQKKLTTQPSITLTDLMDRFADENACNAYLRDSRWPNGVTCPRCGNTKVYELKSRAWHWQCQSEKCGKNGYRFSVKTGTIFENTKYPLRTWFQVAYLMTQSKKGISALQIHRQIKSGDYRTAWYMCQRLRAAMDNETWEKLMGEVEIDETYIGGKDRNRHWSKKSAQRRAAAGELPVGDRIGYGKTGVIGAISRKGNVVCKVMESAEPFHYAGFVRQVVSDRVSLVATDDNKSYKYLGSRIPHQSVNHSRGEYVRGEVHTNSIESFWSLLKRGVVGTYHNVSKDYLPLYLAEFLALQQSEQPRSVCGPD